MKFSTATAFIAALVLHLLILLLLIVNVSLDKPERPRDAGSTLMHATMVTPPARGNPEGKAKNVKPQVKEESKPREEQSLELEKAAAEMKARVEAQKKAEAERVLALKKKEAEKKALEEKKRAEAKARAEAEAKKKAEAEAKRKAEEEAKKKALEEAKRKAEEAERKALEEAKRLEAEAKKKAEAEALRKAEEEAKAKAEAEANALEDELLGTADGVPSGEGLGSGGGPSAEYGARVQTLIEQNWRIDPSMNGKRVVVTVNVDDGGLISGEQCEGDLQVCDSALATLRLIGMLPRPPQNCPDCHTIVITMTPRI